MASADESEETSAHPTPGKARDLVSGGLLGAIVSLSWPMALDQVTTSTARLADLYFLGQLGPAVLAASSLGSMAGFVVFSAAMGVAVAGLAVVARRMGEGNPKAAAHALWQILFLALVLGLIFGGAGAAVAEPFMAVLGARGEVLALAVPYVRASFLLLPPFILNLAANRALRGAGEPRTALWAMAIGSGTTVALCPVLIWGVGSFAGLGIVGSAVAGAVGQSVSFGLAMMMLTSGRLGLVLRLRDATPDLALMGHLLRIGLPVTGQMVLRSTSRLVLAPLIAGFGPSALAAYGIMVRMMMFPLSIGFGLGNAAGTLVGQSLGANRPERAAASAWIIAGANMVIMGVAAGCFLVFSRTLMSALVEGGPQVVSEGMTILRITAPAYVFSALGVVMGRALDGAGDTKPAMWVNLITLWCVLVPLAYGLAHWLDLGAQGIWWGMACANVLNGTIFALWFLRGSWKHRRV